MSRYPVLKANTLNYFVVKSVIVLRSLTSQCQGHQTRIVTSQQTVTQFENWNCIYFENTELFSLLNDVAKRIFSLFINSIGTFNSTEH